MGMLGCIRDKNPWHVDYNALFKLCFQPTTITNLLLKPYAESTLVFLISKNFRLHHIFIPQRPQVYIYSAIPNFLAMLCIIFSHVPFPLPLVIICSRPWNYPGAMERR